MRERDGRRVSSYLCWGLCLIVLADHALTTAWDYISFLRGTRSTFSTTPAHRYGIMRVPDGSDGPPALGADFSQVYFSALAIRKGDAPYDPQNPAFQDRFGRRPIYPPLANYLYIPLTFLAYRDALVVHTLASLALFLGATALVLLMFGLGREVLAAGLACLMLGFLTPVGFSHFERGQFYLVVGTSHLLVVAAVYARRASLPLAVGGALLGALKWTAFPLLGLFSVLGFVASPTPRRRLVFLAVPAILVLSVMAFASEIPDFWPSLRMYELEVAPKGVSLELLMPRWIAKAVPALLTLVFVALFAARARRGMDRQRALEAVALPFALALALLTQAIITVVYEYRIVSLLGLLPMTVVWLERAESVPRVLRNGLAILLGVFLVMSFRVFDLGALSVRQMLFVYCTAAAGFLAMAVLILWSQPASGQAGRAALASAPGATIEA